MSAQHRQTTNYQRACSSFSPTEPYQRGNNNVSSGLAGMEAHPRWDGTETAASCSRQGKREQSWPFQPAQRAGSFSSPGKHECPESHPGGTHSPTQRRAVPAESTARPSDKPAKRQHLQHRLQFHAQWCNMPPPRCGGKCRILV